MSVYGQPISDRTGLKQSFLIHTGGYDFTVESVSNFDITNIAIDEESKKLSVDINSMAERNISEIIIPRNLIGGNFTVLLDGQPIQAVVRASDTISFITIEFDGAGRHTIEIIGTTYLPEFGALAPLVLVVAIAVIIYAGSRSQLFIK